ncbi:MAG: 3-oxoacyl-[acyl-carrier-protein] reductase [Actinomycetota bacterium]|nr:3-oxoacyl-[acyl-carrier-protein] reductase [Actinomycetota bacterium]
MDGSSQDVFTRCALVTGSSRGIGLAIARSLAETGCNVALNCSAPERLPALEETAADIAQRAGVQVVALAADISKPEEAKQLAEGALASFGRLDILVNNAGITRDGSIVRMTEQDFDDVIDVNLKGAFNCCKAVARPMMRQRFGRIISLSSVVGIHGNAGQVNYAASKAGIIGMTKALSRELASRGITVNAVAPGFIATDMTDALPDRQRAALIERIGCGRLGTPEDVAGVVRFLASDEAGYVTGQVICVDGGLQA